MSEQPMTHHASEQPRARTISPERKRKLLLRGAIIAFLVYPLILPTNWANMGVRTAVWALALLSLVVLTGWVGQISLAQGALMGVGAFTAAQVTNAISLDFPFHAIVAAVAASATAMLIGVAALRIRGLYLAIATLGFQWAMEASFLEWEPFSGGFNGVGIPPLKMDSWDFSDDRLFFYLAWAMAALLFVLAANLRDSKVGRAWFAIRGSEAAASTMGIHVTRYKLLGFAVSGAIIGIAGSINLNYIGTATPLDYNLTKSITYLAVAVLGGIGFIGGALVGSAAFVFSDQIVFAGIDALRGKIEIAAAALLIFTIIRNPGGLISMREDLREKIGRRRVRRERHVPLPVSGGQEPAALEPIGNARWKRRLRSEQHDARVVLGVQNVSVRFGGVHALDDVSLEVHDREICGLIGPNGAGKTTLFNAINALITPERGRFVLDDRSITDLSTHERAAAGLARTFQIMRLFPRLSVFDNVMIATHLVNRSGALGNLLLLQRSRGEDAACAERVRAVLRDLGLEKHAETPVSELPFGTLRMVELARAIVAEPRLLLLDEPASGLDAAETARLAEHLIRIRDDRGLPILLIEHDMNLVMELSDHIYALDFGRMVADGSPDEIRANKTVISAYLGETSVA